MTLHFSQQKVLRVGLKLGVLSVTGCGLFCAGCTAPETPPPIKSKAPATQVGRMEAWRDAEMITDRDTGRMTMIGSGDSMRPIYGEHTMLVLSKIAYEDLRAGMQVAYVNAAGRRVVHVLLSRNAAGWVVQGLNNENVDREQVTRSNLIGVVYASFATDGEG
jgi:hypothetical protein